jgi:hypothetical protein
VAVRATLLALVALTLAGPSADAAGGFRAGCASGQNRATGLLHGGVYTTRCFLPGMRITVPAGWLSAEDTSIELKLLPPNSTDNDTPALRFWIDPHASTPCTDVALPADISTPTKIVGWLRRNKNLTVSAPRRAVLARGIDGLTVDLDDSSGAPRCDPTCAGPCLDYFLFEAPGSRTEPYGTGRGEPVRLYFAEIGPPAHLFVFDVDAPSPKALPGLAKVAAKILAGVRLPAKLPSRQGR